MILRMSAIALLPLGLPLGLSTAGEASEALPFGLSMGELQTWTLVYLGLSSLAFVVVWVLGDLRRCSPWPAGPGPFVRQGESQPGGWSRVSCRSGDSSLTNP